MIDKIPVIRGRQCGECSMCCKLMAIDELEKPIGEWCKHVLKRRGCAIYETRPPSCEAFQCGYLVWPVAGEHWFPFKSKMVIVIEDQHRMAIHVDPATPHVWKAEPYYSDLKSWAWEAARRDQQLVVLIARRMIAILPDREVDLGLVKENEVVVISQFDDGSYGAETIKADDPAIRGMKLGKPYSVRK